METTIQLGEKAFPIRLKLGVFDHLKEITGQDGISFVQGASENITFGMYALLLAGMECYRDKHRGQEINKDEVMNAVKADADIEDFTNLISLYTNFMNPGEAKAQEKVIPSPGQAVKNSPTDALD